MKVAISVLSDPTSGGEEALGRVFNALAVAYDYKHAGAEAAVLFQGAGTRWVESLSDPEHPVHGLYQAVADTVVGMSCGCADVFGAGEAAEAHGIDLVTENAVPGTSGLPSLRRYVAEGYTVLTF